MIGGRWAVVVIEARNGPVVKVLTPFDWYPEAHAEMERRRKQAGAPELLVLATCKECGGSDVGCSRCNPDEEAIP